MNSAPVINITEIIDRQPLGGMQVIILFLCASAALLDGMDLQSIGLAAPSMIPALHIEPRAFGAVFSAALLGLMLGASVLGPMADRVGRKPVLIGSVITFGIFTVCTAQAGDFRTLLIFRFLTGLGLGGAMPSFISLGSEFVARPRRAVMVALLWAGFPLGGLIGGLLASRLIPAFGWQSVFYVGGIAPLVLAVLLMVFLPESIGFLVATGGNQQRVVRLYQRLTGTPAPTDARFIIAEERPGTVSVRHLFDHGRAAGTLLLWANYFLIFLMLVTNSAWSPTLLRGAGIDIAHSGLAMAAFNGGSVIGTSAAGWLIHRYGATGTLSLLFVASALSLGSVGFAAPSFAWITTLETLTGLFLGAGSSGLIALAAIFYPLSIRSTGVGWATAVGRFGSFAGPLLMAMLVARGAGIGPAYAALGAPALLAAILTVSLGLLSTTSDPVRLAETR